MLFTMFLCEIAWAWLSLSCTNKVKDFEDLGSPRAGASCNACFSPIKACSCLSSQGRGAGTEILQVLRQGKTVEKN